MTLYDNYLYALMAVYGGVLIKKHFVDRNSAADDRQKLTAVEGEHDDTADKKQSLFKRFQREFLVVYLIMMAADWMQGPYVYRLYEYYGFTRADNGILFIAGFGSSLVFGTWAGPIAGTYGRRFSCVLYGVAYTLSCLTKHVNNFNVLMLGRLLGGFATSILWASFESWMVSEHNSRGFASSTINGTFSQMTAFNGIVAIASGFIAQWAVDFVGHPVAPFDVSALFLVCGTLFIRYSWPENYGAQSKGVVAQMTEAAREVTRSPTIFLVGLQQALFEGAMYTFVFLWTPALQPDDTVKIPHGLIFACFMIATSLGGTVFGLLSSVMPVHTLLTYLYAIACATMVVPIVSGTDVHIMGAFVVFEMVVGLFWPGIGTLRSQQVPENCRATVINLFRVPLNAIVCGVLYFQGSMHVGDVFKFCAAFHGLALLTSIALHKYIATPGSPLTTFGGH
jgi:MFS family permease